MLLTGVDASLAASAALNTALTISNTGIMTCGIRLLLDADNCQKLDLLLALPSGHGAGRSRRFDTCRWYIVDDLHIAMQVEGLAFRPSLPLVPLLVSAETIAALLA